MRPGCEGGPPPFHPAPEVTMLPCACMSTDCRCSMTNLRASGVEQQTVSGPLFVFLLHRVTRNASAVKQGTWNQSWGMS